VPVNRSAPPAARTSWRGARRPACDVRRPTTIEEVRPGYFRGQLMLARQRHSVHGESREEVLDKLNELRRRFRAGTLAEGRADRTTVGEHLERWLAGKRGTVADKTWRNHERNVALHLVPTLGRFKVSALTAEHLRGLYARLQPPDGHLARRACARCI
jgi:hypothetical protein